MAKLRNYFFDKDIYKSPIYLSLVCFFFGLFFSRALLSISIILILAASVHSLYISKEKRLNYFSLAFIPFYLILLLSYWNSTNYNYWLNLTFKNSIFLILPLAFFFLNKIKDKIILSALNIFLGLTLTTAVINAIYALINYNLISNLALNSKTLNPLIGSNFHDISLIYAITIVYLSYQLIKYKKLNYLNLSAFLILGICITILSYRFALIIFILSGFIVFIIYLNFSKQLIFKSILLVLIFGLGFFYKPLVNRFRTTMYDLKSIYGDVNPNYKSLGQRWAAIKCSTEIIKKNPFIGVGAADLPLEMEKQYEQNSYLLIPENRIFIHNQFFYYAASFGLLGLLCFLGFLGFLINRLFRHKQFLGLAILTVFLAQMLIENSLEIQIPSYLFLILMLGFSAKNDKIYS